MKAEKGGKAAADGWMGRRSGRLRERKGKQGEEKTENREKENENAHRRTSKLHLKLFWGKFFTEHPAPDLWLATTKAPRSYDQAQFRDGCYLFFGKETAGLPLGFREEHRERCIRIPMRPDARSLNLANSVAVVAYEALRQLGFPGLSGQGEMAEGL